MAKRLRGSCSKENTKVVLESEEASIDRISMLPDALLVSILSLLTFKESTATSVLSRRWRYMWTLVPKLDFDGSESLMKVVITRDVQLVIQEERSQYVRWVDHVLELHRSSTIEEFRVFHNLNKSYEKYIDKWVKYALARNVKRLELNLAGVVRIGDFLPHEDCYTFPFDHIVPETLDAVEVKDREQGILPKDKENCSNGLPSPNLSQNSSIHFQYLEKISLNHVNVNGAALEFLLCNCPLLEHLSVSKSYELSTLKIIGPFPSLKHLEIISCYNLNSFEICDANLVYLKYIGTCIQQCLLKNIPLLVEMYIEGPILMGDVLSMFSSIFPQLEKLTFKFGFILSWEVADMFYSAVIMSKLKQLVLRPIFNDSLLPLTNILRTSPGLETFVLEISRFATRDEKRQLQKIAGSYTHLKEVIVRGFGGWASDLEFVMHLSECAGALEKIVIDPLKPSDTPDCYMERDTRNEFMYKCRVDNARVRAKNKLVGQLPSRINLQIL